MFRKPRAHHKDAPMPPDHLQRRPPHHHRHSIPGAGPICRLIQEVGPFAALGDAYDFLDEVLDEASLRTGIPRSDLGEGNGADAPRSYGLMRRALQADAKLQDAARQWLLKRCGERVLAAGEFPPHLLHLIITMEATVAQCHAVDHRGNLPPHFGDLAPYGLEAVPVLNDIDLASYSIVIFRGFIDGNCVWCDEIASSLLSRPLPTPVQLLAADHILPHFTVCVDDAPYVRIPIFE